MFLTPFFAFLLCAGAFALLLLASISTPLVRTFFFLSVSQAGGTHFGLWGWCSADSNGACSIKALGIDWNPELAPFWLTKALVTFPIAAGITFLALLSLIPQMFSLCYHRHTHRRIHSYNRHSYTYAPYPPTAGALVYTPTGQLVQTTAAYPAPETGIYEFRYGFPSPAYTILVLLATIAAILAMIFSLALLVPARKRFRDEGFDAALGNCIWFSIAAAALLLIATMGAGCGCVARGRFSRASPYLAYNV